MSWVGVLRARASRQRGFTFLEVLSTLLVAGVGLMAIVALAVYGLASSARSQGALSGMATAITVAVDPQPYLDDASNAQWSNVPYAMGGTGALTAKAQGYINGYWAVRTETSSDQDIIAQAPSGTVYARSANVAVDIYDTIKGNLVASYNTRLIRQRATP